MVARSSKVRTLMQYSPTCRYSGRAVQVRTGGHRVLPLISHPHISGLASVNAPGQHAYRRVRGGDPALLLTPGATCSTTSRQQV